jgi:hypothetical protein
MRAMETRRGPRYDWKGFLLLCAIFLVVAFLWDTPWVHPLKLLVVLFHELSHGIAAAVTGGTIAEIQVHRDQGGHCVTSGGIPMVVVSAGYLGSLLFGVLVLLAATRTRAAPVVAGLLGAVLAVVAFRFVPSGTFGWWFAGLWALALVVMAFLPRAVSEIALRVVGVTSCLYAILDIKSDVLDRDHPESDASQLAAMTGVPPFLWGVFWIGISLVATAVAAKWSITGPPRRAPEVASRRS